MTAPTLHQPVSNTIHADDIRHAISTYPNDNWEGPPNGEPTLSRMLADAMHYCVDLDIDFRFILNDAHVRFESENSAERT